MAPYQYSSLKNPEIRLLELSPGHFDDALCAAIYPVPLNELSDAPDIQELRTTLPPGWAVYETVEGWYIFEHAETDVVSWTHPRPDYTVSLDAPVQHEQPPDYEALSYTWDTDQNPSILQIQADQPGLPLATIDIQQNLAIALRHLRFHDKPRTLWVDAVCINQKDVNKRNAQVPRMTSIYRRARSVVAWVGASSPDSQTALSIHSAIGSEVELAKCATRLRTPSANHPDWHHSGGALPFNKDEWRSVQNLLSRPWFDRVWIVQEVQLANPTATLQCGPDSMNWLRLCRAAWCIFRKQKAPYAPLAQRLAQMKMLIRPLEAIPFRHLLHGASNRLCTDPRDHVYGTLGLASPAVARLIQPQYTAEVSTVFMNAFLAMLGHTSRLDALQDCSLKQSSPRPSYLPSWVPDWSTQ